MYTPTPPCNSLFFPAHPKYNTGENVGIYHTFKHFNCHFTVCVCVYIHTYIYIYIDIYKIHPWHTK